MSNNKSWERPWSMDEIIENSENWNLAGDVALLNSLKSFADNLLAKTTEINTNLQNLTNNLDETSLKLNIAQNEFQSLRNTQFIESRVYEDDESLPQNEEIKKNDEKQEDVSDEVRLAALKGLEVLEQYFDKVEVSVSDSEDEDIDLPNYILRPKDLYIQRPLPYVIGTDEWYKTLHVGLEDSSSDSETEKVSDKFSESDSETDLPIIQDRSQIKGTSDTSSEFDYSQKTKKSDIFNSSENSSENSIPAAPISNKNFAEELAAKLDNVITDLEPEINKKPIQKVPKTNYDNIFFDEPPPLDEPKGLFSGGRGLFDDDDDDNQSLRKGGLFTGGDSSEDDDILTKKTLQTAKPVLFPGAPPATSQAGLLDEEPPTLDVPKKPIGGVSIFGGGSLFDKKLLKRRVSSEDDEEPKQKKEEKQKIDLFGADTIFDSPPKTIEVKQDNAKKMNLFDSDDDKDENRVFSTKEKSPEKLFTGEKPVLSQQKKISLFDDDDDLFKDDLFSTNSTKKSFTSGLFDDISGEDLFSTETTKTKSKNLFDDLVTIPDNNSINSSTNLENNSQYVNKEDEKPRPKPRLSLFDSPPPETDDLFKETDLFSKSTPTHQESIRENKLMEDMPSVISKSPPKPLFDEATPPDVHLFDSSPPPDDDWETKSDPLSENDDFNDFQQTEGTTSLFSEEPPSLPETVLKPKPGKLKHNLKINVGALLPGSAPRKFGEKVRTDDDMTSPVSEAPSVNIPVTSPTSSSITSPSLTSPSETLPISFDETDRVEVLHSVTKDRARVPLNRRPSTRRGRKAALQKTSSDFVLEREKEIEENKEKPGNTIKEKSLFDDGDGKKENLLFSEGIKSEDLFGEKPGESKDLFEKSLQSQANDSLFGKSPESDLFGKIAFNQSKDNSQRKSPDTHLFSKLGVSQSKNDNLFGKSPTSDLLETRPESDDLFGEAENTNNLTKTDDLFQKPQSSLLQTDLFGNSPSREIPKKTSILFQEPSESDQEVEDLFKKPPKTNNTATQKKDNQSKSSIFDDEDDDIDDLFTQKKPLQQPKNKKSLFDDEDDDDIFKSFSTTNPKKTETKVATEKKIAKMSSVKKLENTKPDDDPLSALLK